MHVWKVHINKVIFKCKFKHVMQQVFKWITTRCGNVIDWSNRDKAIQECKLYRVNLKCSLLQFNSKRNFVKVILRATFKHAVPTVIPQQRLRIYRVLLEFHRADTQTCTHKPWRGKCGPNPPIAKTIPTVTGPVLPRPPNRENHRS